MSLQTRVSWLLVVLTSLASALRAETVTRRLGTPPKAPPGKAVRKPRPKPPTAYAAEAAAAPKIDGALSDAVWADAPLLKLTRTLDGVGQAAQSTEVRLLHDEKALYAAFRCTEPEAGRLRASRRGHDGDVWSDDSVEIFLGLGGGYYHFGVNAVGSTYDARARDKSWNSGIRAAAGRGGGEWTAEVAIPLSRIAAAGKLPTDWTANFHRNRYVTGSLQEATWSPTYSGDSHVPDRFGRLLLKAPPKAAPGRDPANPAVPKAAMKVLQARKGLGVVRFDLSALPKAAKIHCADLRIFRSSELTGLDEEALVDIAIHPLFAKFAAGDEPEPRGAPLALRGPWHDRFDATDAVRRWAAGEPNGGFFVKACPRWDAEATCLDVAYEGSPEEVPPQVTGLRAFHRSGQTFITWKEIEDLVGSQQADRPSPGADLLRWGELKAILAGLDRDHSTRYCVYRSDKPITARTLREAELIATVKPLSCWNVNGRNIDRPIDEVIATKDALMCGQWNPFDQASVDGEYGRDCPIDRFVIREGEKPLPAGTGLHVHTASEKASAYYAVVTSIDGVQNTRDFSVANSLAGPLAEAQGSPEPVLQGKLPPSPIFSYADDRLHYVRWVGPPYVNLPYQYYNWSVAVPKNPGKGVALELNLHRDGHSYWRTHYRIEQDSIVLCPHDFPFGTWWYGYHSARGTLKSFRQGKIHNYTERRLLGFVQWAASKWPVDANRITVTGCRDGASGSGALHLGIRHPEVFSLVISGHGLPDYAFVATQMKDRWTKPTGDSMQALWGKVEWGLATDADKNVWDELNLTKMIARMPAGKELPLVAMTSRGGWPVFRNFYAVMFEKRRAILAEFQWGGGRIVPVSMTGTYPNNIRLDVRRNRSLLAFQSPAAVALVRKGGMGEFNREFRWRGSDAVDETERYEVTIYWSGRGSGATGEITVRQLQRFRVRPGGSYSWAVRSLEGGKVLQQGEVTVGEDGLLTIKDVKVGGPSRLIVTPK